MPKLNEYTFKSGNCKNNIYVREWLPDSAPTGVVQIVHGVAEHMPRYDGFAQFLASKGFVVSGNDHLGHGNSIGSLNDQGYFGEHGGWELVVGDVRKLYEQLRERYPNVPRFIFGHSMGSFITRTYVIRYHDGPDGVILSGTGQQAKPMVSAGIALANREIRHHGAAHPSELVNKVAFGSYNRKIKKPISEYDWVTRDRDSLEEYLSDPLCGFVPTAGLFRDMFTGIKYVSSPRNLTRVNKDLPIFLISGTADPVGDYGKGVIRTYKGYTDAGLQDVTLKLYPNARHELVGDINRQAVFEDVLDWLTKHSDRK